MTLTSQPEDEHNKPKTCSERWTHHLENSYYRAMLCGLTIYLLTLLLLLDNLHTGSGLSDSKMWKFSIIIGSEIFFVDLILNLIVTPFKFVLEKKKYLLLEIILQLAVFLCFLNAMGYAVFEKQLKTIRISYEDIASVTVIMRVIRLTDFFIELQPFTMIYRTCVAFIGPFASMLAALYLVFYIYASIGMVWFGGCITTISAQVDDPSIPALYYLMNFNDFGTSIITLFHIMVVNNWFLTTNMLSLVDGGSVWPKVFISSFWVLCVLIVTNLIIANVLEIYDSRVDEVDSLFEKRKETKALKEHLAGKTDVEMQEFSVSAFEAEFTDQENGQRATE